MLEHRRIWRGNENIVRRAQKDLPTYHISAYRCSISRVEAPLNCSKTPSGSRLFLSFGGHSALFLAQFGLSPGPGAFYLVIYLFHTFCDPLSFISPPNAKGFKGLGYVAFLYFQSQRREH